MVIALWFLVDLNDPLWYQPIRNGNSISQSENRILTKSHVVLAAETDSYALVRRRGPTYSPVSQIDL